MTAPARPPVTAEELLVHPAGRYADLVAGALRVSEPPGWAHGHIAVQLAALLHRHVEQHGLGRVSVESGYLLARNPDTVRGPDVSFVSAGRLGPEPLPRGYFAGAPDLAVEILSPTETASALLEKVEDYLAAGSALVWVVDPFVQSVTVFEAGRSPRRLDRTAVLEGGEVVRGFTCRLSELFDAC
jgi:Uma2 family endonuclease